MNKIRYIIFDVGGVLLKEKIDKAHDALNQELGKKVFDRNDMLHKKALLGKISERHFFRLHLNMNAWIKFPPSLTNQLFSAVLNSNVEWRKISRIVFYVKPSRVL